MKILFLDDDVERHILFRAKNPGAVQVTYPVTAMLELRDDGPWDEVWLDHDLCYIGDPSENTIDTKFVHDSRPLVRWIAENKPAVKKFVIHSWNNGGATWMACTLRDAGYDVVVAPFSVTHA